MASVSGDLCVLLYAMMNHKVMLIFIFLIPAGYQVSGQDVWAKYAPTNALVSYEVEVPGKMSYTLDTITTDIGAVMTESYYYKAVDPETPFVYMINHIQYSADLKDSLSTVFADDLMDTTVRNLLESVNGRLVYQIESPHKVLDIQQYHILYEQDKKSLKSRMFVVDNHLFNIQVMTPADLSIHEYVDRFLDSFKLH